jgi:hypothetical protein
MNLTLKAALFIERPIVGKALLKILTYLKYKKDKKR